jgi:diguanylate cyclase (GGDEF)-like protein
MSQTVFNCLICALLCLVSPQTVQATTQAEDFVTHTTQALDQLNTPSEQLAYLLSIANKLNHLSEPEKGHYYSLLAGTQEKVGKLDDALQNYTLAIEMLEPFGASDALVNSFLERSYIAYLNTNDPKQYCPDREAGLNYARQIEQPETLVKSLTLRAFCFQGAGSFHIGLGLLSEALHIAKANKLSPNRLAMIYSATGAMYRASFLHNKALTYFKNAYQLWRQVDDTQDIFNMLHNMIGETVSLSLWVDADKYLTEMHKMVFTHPEFKDFQFFYHHNVGKRYLFSHDFAQAVQHFERAITLQKTTQEAYFIHLNYAFLAIGYLHKGETEKALRWASAFNQSSSREASPQDLKMTMEAMDLLGQKKYLEAYNVLLKTANYERHKYAELLNNAVINSALDHHSKVTEYENKLLENQLSINQLELKAQMDDQRITRLSMWMSLLLLLAVSVITVTLYQSRRYFKRGSQTDFLTGIANRRFTMEEGDKAFIQSQKQDNTLALVMFDIDFFKKINDNYGHDIGDLAIKALAQRSKHVLKDKDILGRIGGEEFLLILPNTDLEEALRVAERLRASIADQDFKFKDVSIHFSISLGVAISPGLQRFNQLLKQSDLALYKAKNSGRNCVCIP